MPMRWAQIRDWLLPGGWARDEGFHQEILSASFRGIWAVAGVEAVVALIGFTGHLPRGAAFGLLLVGAATLGAARLGAAYPHNRVLAGVSACAASVIAVRAMPAGARSSPRGYFGIGRPSAQWIPLSRSRRNCGTSKSSNHNIATPRATPVSTAR